ncbi:MAG: hypothetical protein LBQ07_02175 [Endomicrobium sp.]|jgi:hypothetical protein|nr:hypothetical protein [Endomicrobium sp.]
MVLIHVSKVMDLVKKHIKLDENFFIIMKIWKKMIEINNIEILGYKNNIIFVKTDNSVTYYEFIIQKKGIINKLNQYIIDNKKIKDIKIIIE